MYTSIADKNKEPVISSLPLAKDIIPRAKRWYMDEVVGVYDLVSGKKIGNLSDISETGIGIITFNAHQPGDILNIKLVVKSSHQDIKEFIELRVHVVRSQQKKIKHLHKIGVTFKPLNAKTKIRLIKLFSNLEKTYLSA